MSSNISRICRGILPVVCLLLFSGVALKAQNQAVGPVVIGAAQHDVSPPLREIAPIAPERGPKHEMHRHDTIPLQVAPSQTDPVLQTSAGPLVATTAGLNFDGIGQGAYGYTVSSAPPDTNGAVGTTQFMQWVNQDFAVFNKSTGALVYGPAAGNTFWTGFGGACETSNSGDPIAQYDKAAGRWVVTQPVFTSPYLVCVAVSTTSDATGTYNRYVFSMPSFPDYPKLGVWPDAYYMSFNMFGRRFLGANACAMDRAKMLAGAAATMQCFQQSSSVASLLPSDLDGTTAPPAGSPAFFLNFASNSLNLWKFHVDFTTPANSTFLGPINLPVAAFTPACNGGACIPQLGTSQTLDSLGDRLMYRLAYRNFGNHDSLVVNHSVTAGSSVGVRWYELQNPNSNPVVFQQGTYAPDSDFRWMGSIAMDSAGDMAVGYSASSSSINPAIRYTGRTSADPLGVLQAESSIIAGTGSQLSGLSRWGDYSAMSVDPVDDCTFWYTTEYLKADGTFNWNTRIASFKFASCGTTTAPAAPTGLVGTAGNAQVSLTWNASSGATSYNVLRSTTTGGPYNTVATVTTSSYIDTGLTNGTTYYYVVQAVNSAGTSPNSNEASATPVCSIPAAPTGLTPTAGNGQVSLSWNASSGATNYSVKRSTISGGPYTTIASSVTSTSYTDTGLTNGTTYYYVVSASNACGESANSGQVSATPAAASLPPAPTGLTATAGPGAKKVSLSWTASSGAASYNVKRSTTSGGPYTTVATGVTTTSFTDMFLNSGTTYYYVVSALNSAGESPNSNEASATAN